MLCIVLALKIAFSLFIANRGFDLTDEGCYMLWYQYPDKDPNPFYYFHKMVLGFFPFINWDIVSLRMLKMASDLSITVLIAAALYRNLPNGAKHLSSFCFLLGVAGLGYYSIIYSRIFYEGDMSYFLAVMALGIPLLFLRQEHRIGFFVSLVISGVFVGLQFFNKFSASIVSLLLVCALSVYLTRKGWGLLATLAGVAIGVLLFFVATGYMPKQWLQEYLNGYKYVIEPLGYNPLHLLLFYAFDGMVLLVLVLLPLGLFALVRFMAQKLWQRQVGHLVFTLIVTLLYGLYYLLLPHTYSDAHYHYQSLLLNYWYVPIASVVVYLFFMVGTPRGYSKEEIVVLLSLLLMPFVSLVGTGTSLAVSASAYLIPWYGILGWLMVRHFTLRLLPAMGLIACIAIVAFVCFHVQYPFRLNASVGQQKVLLKAPQEEIYVDSTLATFVSNTKSILKAANIPDGYPIVALHNLPGLVYLLGGYSPATPWYFDAAWLNEPEYNEKLHDANCQNLARIKQFENRLPVFLIDEYALSAVTPCLLNNGFNLSGEQYHPPMAKFNPFLARERSVLNRQISDSLLIFIPIDQTPLR